VKHKSVESVNHTATLEQECPNEVRMLTKRNGETLPWLKSLPIGIRESRPMVLFLKRGGKAVEFMVECEDEKSRTINGNEPMQNDRRSTGRTLSEIFLKLYNIIKII
jgi:hypothetical protein